MSNKNKTAKNIIICLDGTGNQYGGNHSNVLKLFRMLDRDPEKQIAYYDPGVGTMGDPTLKTGIGRTINKVLGLAFGKGLMKNLIEAYTFLMEEYQDGDKVFIFGFSRGAYTARVLAAFIKECGLLERSGKNLLPYAMENFLQKAPANNKKKEEEFYKILNGFRSTYSRAFNHDGDPLNKGRKGQAKYQLRIQFLGLFDTVKSYGWVSNPPVLRNEKVNPSVLKIRHALAIDEKRAFFHQMHWKASKGNQSCKEVWFAGDHSDVGGGHPKDESGLAKHSLEWMVHEAINEGMKVIPEEYGDRLQRELDKDDKWVSSSEKDLKPKAMIHGVSLYWAWKLIQLLPKSLEPWEKKMSDGKGKGMRTIKSELERLEPKSEEGPNSILLHKSVIDILGDGQSGFSPKDLSKKEVDENKRYSPKNLSIENGVIHNKYEIVETIKILDTFSPIDLELLRKRRPVEETIERDQGIIDNYEAIIKDLIGDADRSVSKDLKGSRENIDLWRKELEGLDVNQLRDLLLEQFNGLPLLSKDKDLSLEELKESLHKQVEGLKLDQVKQLSSLDPSAELSLLEPIKQLSLLKRKKDSLLKVLKGAPLPEHKEDSLLEELKELSLPKQEKDALFEKIKARQLEELDDLLLRELRGLSLPEDVKKPLLEEVNGPPLLKHKNNAIFKQLKKNLRASINLQYKHLEKLEKDKNSLLNELKNIVVGQA